MQDKLKLHIIIWSTGLLLLACSQTPHGPKPGEIAREQEELVRVNKYLVGEDADRIRAYIKRHNWDMKTTKTGLWYMIYEKGKGPAVTEGEKVTMNYKVWLLDGTLCYSSDKLGPKTFAVGKGGVEPGLDEGVRMLRVGDKARFILPPYLADGLLGDENRIPARSIILYEVELTQISD